MPDSDEEPDELEGVCSSCQKEADTRWFVGWAGGRELCDECYRTAVMEE